VAIRLHGTVGGKYLHGTVDDVTGTVNWHSKSSHKLTGTVNDIVGTVNEEYKGKYRNTTNKY
jgi:hypothetical protein